MDINLHDSVLFPDQHYSNWILQLLITIFLLLFAGIRK